jgi:threonine/homoserine/homoserine lactone efflux protein
LSSFFLMMANPFIVISFFGVFAAVDIATGHEHLLEAIWLGAGVFIGSSAWWAVYKLAAAWFGDTLRKNGLHVIDAVAGTLICAFGVWQLAEVALAW